MDEELKAHLVEMDDRMKISLTLMEGRLTANLDDRFKRLADQITSMREDIAVRFRNVETHLRQIENTRGE